jgi:poly-beta-1,6-N-acetyl-D-glucosamine synthase
MMTIFFFVVFAMYFVLVLLLITGWQLAMEKRKDAIHDREKLHLISVIVPFRDEEKNLSTLLKDLQHQRYGLINFEIILVDDHSSDRSSEMVRTACFNHPHFKLLTLSAHQQGKKAALTMGIENSQGEIIVTTDADCSLSPDWLTTINESFSSEKVMMAIGAVRIEPDASFFSQLQAMEFASLVGSGAATLSYGIPTMCNGANLAFRKAAFSAVNGYEGNLDIPSGDDEFLMRKIAKKFPNSISFIAENNNVVTTQAQPSLSAFLHQRWRWAGKWKHNESIPTKALAVFIFVFQLSYLLVGLFLIAGWVPMKIGVMLISTKLLLEFLFLYQVTVFLRLPWRWSSFFSLQFIYPIYVCWVGLLAQGKQFVWKGRKVTGKR